MALFHELIHFLVDETVDLNRFKKFDALCQRMSLEKIKQASLACGELMEWALLMRKQVDPSSPPIARTITEKRDSMSSFEVVSALARDATPTKFINYDARPSTTPVTKKPSPSKNVKKSQSKTPLKVEKSRIAVYPGATPLKSDVKKPTSTSTVKKINGKRDVSSAKKDVVREVTVTVVPSSTPNFNTEPIIESSKESQEAGAQSTDVMAAAVTEVASLNAVEEPSRLVDDAEVSLRKVEEKVAEKTLEEMHVEAIHQAVEVDEVKIEIIQEATTPAELKKSQGLKITPSREIVEKEEHADELARSPEPELLKYQRSKTMPKIALIEVNEDSEELILEIDNIEQLQDQDKLEYGMLPAGSDEIIMGTL
jgi:hypothetical protein